MITKGTELTTFITGLNGGASIDATLLDVLVDTAKSIIEEERPWMVLRKTDTSKSLTTANLWTTSLDISTITDFSRFYGELPVILFDGDNKIQHYRLIPFDRRLEYKDVSNTFCHDENAKKLYFNGVVPFAGTLYINYVSTSSAIDLTADVACWTSFPSRFLPLLGFYSVGVHKGAVDYDSINKLMLPSNQVVMVALKNAMEKWDNEKQMSSIENNDPTESYDGSFKNGAVNRNG